MTRIYAIFIMTGLLTAAWFVYEVLEVPYWLRYAVCGLGWIRSSMRAVELAGRGTQR